MALLRQNSELRKDGIWNWTIPAWHVRLDDGKLFKTCPNAGICAQYCYALNGTYLFSNVKEAHKANLEYVLRDPHAFEAHMIHELKMAKFRPRGERRRSLELVNRLMEENPTGYLLNWLMNGGAAVRIHDAGDFFADWYLDLWIRVADETPDVLFYAYTKEVEMFQNTAYFPPNFRFLFSTGGLQDHLIGDARHADVFPEEDMTDGYASQSESDLLAVFAHSPKVGIPANNIKHFKKKMAGRRFSELVKPTQPDGTMRT